MAAGQIAAHNPESSIVTAASPQAIDIAFAYHWEHLDRLEHLVERLSLNLRPVLAPALPPLSASGKPEDMTEGSPIRTALENSSARIYALEEAVEGLLHRLEI